MKESDITDEQIIEEVKEILVHPEMRRCAHCANSDEECSWCSQMKKPLAKYMYAGHCRYFETDEERAIRFTRENLKRMEKEENKMNLLLTMALNCIDTSLLFIEDFAARVEKEYQMADRRGTGDRKVRQADRNWIANFKKASKAMSNNIEGARKQFQHYIMPIFNKVFFDKEINKYDVEKYDDHQSDCHDFAFSLLKTFDTKGTMDEQDLNHYNFRR